MTIPTPPDRGQYQKGQLEPKHYASALWQALEQTHPKDHDIILEKFVKILAGSGSLDQIELIEREYRLLLETSQSPSGNSEHPPENNTRLIGELNLLAKKEAKLSPKEGGGPAPEGIVFRVEGPLPSDRQNNQSF